MDKPFDMMQELKDRMKDRDSVTEMAIKNARAEFAVPLTHNSEVEIIGTEHAQHAHMIGSRARILKFVKSRGIYRLMLPNGKTWESYPHNIRGVE